MFFVFPAKTFVCVYISHWNYCFSLFVLAKGLFHLWQVRHLPCFDISHLPPFTVRTSGGLSPFILWVNRLMCVPQWNAGSCLPFGHVKACRYAFSVTRLIPKKMFGCPPFSVLLTNSLTLILLSCSLLDVLHGPVQSHRRGKSCAVITGMLYGECCYLVMSWWKLTVVHHQFFQICGSIFIFRHAWMNG